MWFYADIILFIKLGNFLISSGGKQKSIARQYQGLGSFFH